MAQPRIQHKRGSTGPTSSSGITAGEFAISLGTGPAGPFNVFVGVSGSTTPIRVGSQVVTNFNSTNNNNIPTTEAVSDFVNTKFAAQVIGVCFMEGPSEGEGTIDIRSSSGGPGSGFSGFLGVTFQISFAKSITPKQPGDGGDAQTDPFGANHLHRTLVGDAGDGFNPKRLTLGNFLGYIGYCGGDVSVDQFGKATITGVLGANNGGLGFTALGLTYGEIPMWLESGWTAARLQGGTGIEVISGKTLGVTLALAALSPNPAGSYGSASAPVQIPALTIDPYGRVTAATTNNLNLYNLNGGFTQYVFKIFDQIFSDGSTFMFNRDGIHTDYTNDGNPTGNRLTLRNAGITGISVNGTYYTGGIILSAGSGISLDVSSSNPETITITNLGAVGVSGNISFQGHTQGNVYLSNFTGSQNLVITKGAYGVGFDPATGRCGYAVFVGLSSGIELPSNIPNSSAFISVPTGYTGWGAGVGVCFGSTKLGTGGARGFIQTNRIEATGNAYISGSWASTIPGTILELNARGGTEASRTTNDPYVGRNARIILASYPSDQWNLLSDINGDPEDVTGLYANTTRPNRGTPLPGLSGIADAEDIESGTVRLYNNARVESNLLVGSNLYVLGNYYDNTGATLEFTKLAYISNNNFDGTLGQNGFEYPTGASFGNGIITLGASGNSASDSGILYNFKNSFGGPTAAFFGIDGSSGAFVARIATTSAGITGSCGQAGELNLTTSATILAPIFVGAINGITFGYHTGNTSGSILLASGHRLGLCGAFGLTFSVSANNTVTIPAESTQPTTLVTLTNTQTMTNKTLGADCVIDCGTY